MSTSKAFRYTLTSLLCTAGIASAEEKTAVTFGPDPAPIDKDIELEDNDTRATEKDKVAVVEPANDLSQALGPKTDTLPPVTAKHVPTPTPRFRLGLGGFYGQRHLDFDADGETDLYDATGKGLSVNAVAYPFPRQRVDGVLSGVGFSLSVFQSAAGSVGVDTEDTVGNYQFDHSGWDAAVHYRHAAGLVAIDGEVGYGRDNYRLAADTPEEYEIPDTEYTYFHAGAHLDLHVTKRATVGFGAKYLYVTDTGQMSDVDNWYGAGETKGWIVDGNFIVPLPSRLYVRGELKYRHIKTEFDGSGIIADEEVVLSGTDTFVVGSANLGIQF